MNVNNNQQTSFGMRSVTVEGPRRFVKSIERLKPEIMNIGSTECDCKIIKGEKLNEVLVRLTNDTGLVKTETKGKVYLIGTLFDRIRTTHETWAKSFQGFKEGIMG